MKAVILTAHDDANGGARIRDVLLRVGIEAEGYKLHPHKFNYENQLAISTTFAMSMSVVDADIIIFSQVNKQVMEAVIPHIPDNAKVLVIHGGSDYRKDIEGWNRYCNEFCTHTIIQPDCFEQGSKTANNPFMWMAIDTDTLQPVYHNRVIPHILHSPSGAFKGTEKIFKALSELEREIPGKFTWNISDKILSHTENIELMKGCDIYIDELGGGKNRNYFNSWGVSALEAAALGKCVISSDDYDSLYLKEFGMPPFVFKANNESELKKTILGTFDDGEDYWDGLGLESRDLVQRLHSYQAAGKRILEKLGL